MNDKISRQTLKTKYHCAVPENIHTSPAEGSKGEGMAKARAFKEKYEAKLEFPEGWEGANQKPYVRGMDIL